VELENQVRELTKECDMKEQQLHRLEEELKTYKDFLEVSKLLSKYEYVARTGF
jgi:hypothetical protein